MGMSAPPRECERRALLAGARIAARHGMSIHIHTDNSGAYGCDHVADCVTAGLAAERIVVCHMDERLDSFYHREILATGASIGFDTFGSELNFSGSFHHPSDRERLAALVDLLADGYVDQIVLGHDVFTKAHLHAFGGYGYDHLIARVRPALERDYGINRAALDQLFVENPRRLLAVASNRSTGVIDARPRTGTPGK
jgi:phosphotriesterase-related protein